ncbi:MAG: DegT/DnrJ/EryC1/StrS family aminotransferase [Verrucomicrobia bacterium]|nr:DegT/DnrJ/EryC1/StrS family aminotransferase [Verrucomicrobiota bacterium]MCG2679240.1 DegT/DnrJ/EryC1/StrS family aminotransferase [Kiritimatiellia bacterium]MBU4248634.1 DegT/DnrJ/EryC1/StrS family aminotransferase [Verrucomicrobiota bacterium]MBU4290095.1 DegT/DnrJ/EryC1/StrS family aminotransferase [Verrucomicrobiota bacterium]MBU4429793.1 DegT/DnrJ/EryC1/StrS family aminotransferase [Verrucomicrobiota bacterium]
MTKLAIAGGEPELSRSEYKNWPVITADDRRFVNEVLDTGIVCGATAPQCKKLEEEWAHSVGAKYCLTTCSGTAALHMALAAAGVGPGDEVITSAFTFLASGSCALHQNAIPVFVDIDPKTYNIDPNKLEAAITERTKVIIPVHIQGLPADMDPILKIARKHKLFVLEDAAQAHGATYKGRNVGTFGDAAEFSLNALKNLCGGEGGLLVTNDEHILKKASLVRCFGDEIDEVSHRRKYNASILGYMYRNQELPAALARGQLMHLDYNNNIRIANANCLTRELGKIPGVIPPYCPPDSKHVYFMYNVRFDSKAAGVECEPRRFRIAVEKALYKEGLQVGQWQTMPVPTQDLFQSKLGYGATGYPWSVNEAKGIKYNYNVCQYPVAQMLCDTYTVVHGIHPPNGCALMKRIVGAFRKVFQNLDQALAHADDPVFPGMDSNLYGVA